MKTSHQEKYRFDHHDQLQTDLYALEECNIDEI